MGSETPFGQERFALRINLDLCIHALWLLMWALANLFFFFFPFFFRGPFSYPLTFHFIVYQHPPSMGAWCRCHIFFLSFLFFFFFFFLYF